MVSAMHTWTKSANEIFRLRVLRDNYLVFRMA